MSGDAEGPTLEINDLRTTIHGRAGQVRGVDGVSFTVGRGEIFGLAGESGSGKSMTAFSILRLLPPNATTRGEIRFKDRDLLLLDDRAMRDLRGNRIAMIFQDPMTSLNPVFTVGDQISEAVLQHRPVSRREAKAEAIRLMEVVEISDAKRRYGAYPHEFSGGMRQRIVIATALACSPDLLVADEPTTALDVTVERQILAFLQRLRRSTGCAILLITHNIKLMAEHCDRIAIMYAGQIVEMGPTVDLLGDPRHPYTQALIGSLPQGHISQARLKPLTGLPPTIIGERVGCSFAPRCPSRMPQCTIVPGITVLPDRREVRCHLYGAGR